MAVFVSAVVDPAITESVTWHLAPLEHSTPMQLVNDHGAEHPMIIESTIVGAHDAPEAASEDAGPGDLFRTT